MNRRSFTRIAPAQCQLRTLTVAQAYQTAPVAVDTDGIDSQDDFMSCLALLNDEYVPFFDGNTLRDETVEHEPAHSNRADDPYRFGLLDSSAVSGGMRRPLA